MTRIIRGLAAVAALGALLMGIPLALVSLVGRPWPRPMPSVDTIWRSIQAGDISDTTIIKALALLVWVAWARLAVSIVIDVLARVTRSPTPRVGVLGTSQQWAAGLVTAVVLMLGSTAGVSHASAGPGPRPIATQLLRVDTAQRAHTELAHLASPVAPVSSAVMPAVQRPRVEIGTSSHVVQRHESFWSIAQDELGDGARWREIVDANRGVEVGPGVVFDGTASRLLPGWVLRVPRTGAEPELTPQRLGDATTAPAPIVAPIPAATPVTAIEPVPAPAVAPRTVRVERGDTLAEIAAQTMGDASAWPQLFDANRGRAFGDRTFDDPDLILSGWELIVPDVLAPSPATEPPADVAVVAVVDVVDVVDEPVAMPAGAPAAAPVSVDVDAPPVEQALPQPTVEPQPDGAVVAPATLPLAPMVPTVSAAPEIEPDAPQGASVIESSVGDSAMPGGLGTGLLLSSGVLALVGSRRRRRLRGALVTSRLADPSSGAMTTEAVLRSLGDGERVARLDIALRSAASELIAVAPGVSILGVILGHDGRIDVLLTGSAPTAPSPWASVTDHCWRLAARVDLADLAATARRSHQPCPTIAHVGSVHDRGDGGDQLFLDLETLGLLTVEGDRSSSAAIVRAIAAAVAVSPMAEVAHLIACGLDGVLLGHPSATVAESLDVALDVAASVIGTTAATTSANLSTFTLRARHQGGEAWEPAVVFSAGEGSDAAGPGSAADAELVAMTSTGGRGLAIVVDRAVEGAGFRLVQGPGAWTLHPLGLDITPVGLSADELQMVASLLDEADRLVVDDGDVGLDIEPVWADSPWCEPEWALMVRLLGPVEVVDTTGASVTFERSKALELVVWLSQHRERSLRGAARTALWELDVRDATFANVVSDARRAMARAVPTADGEEWIGRTLTDVLPLHPRVTTDIDQLRARLQHARRVPDSDAIAVLRPGLELVRDAPYSGTAYLWPDTEGLSSQLTLAVISAATTLAGLYLAAGDIEGVFWATGRGLQVLSGHEELIAIRMRAHARTGDLAGVRLEWESYERAVSSDAGRGADEELSPKLVQLRRELLSGSMLTQSGRA